MQYESFDQAIDWRYFDVFAKNGLVFLLCLPNHSSQLLFADLQLLEYNFLLLFLSILRISMDSFSWLSQLLGGTTRQFI